MPIGEAGDLGKGRTWGDLKYVKAGQLAGIVSPIGLPICQATSTAGLAAVFRDRLANGAAPDEKLELN